MKMKKPIILLIDNDKINITLIQSFLQFENFDLLSAKTGNEALCILSTLKIDLILLDVRIPGVDSFSLLKLIKENIHLQNIPVIMLSSISGQEILDKSLKLGAAGFILKPISRTTLSNEIKEHLFLKKNISVSESKKIFEQNFGRVNRNFTFRVFIS